MPVRGYRILLCAAGIIFAYMSSAAEARYWRHYGFHWYGHAWNSSRPNSDQRQIEEQRPSVELRNEPRNQVSDFGTAVEQMIRACDRQVVELKNMPLDGVAATVKPADHQRDALEQIRSAALNASETLAAACPRNISAGFHERLDTLSRTLDAMAASLATLRPTFDKFYGLLNDEQKARLVAMTLSKVTLPQSEERSRSRENRPGSSGEGSYCQQSVKYLRSWPVRQVEDRTPLSDDQRASLYDLTASIYRAAGKLSTRCHADDHFTPPGRLDAREEELKALQQSVDSISPEVSRFEDQLTDSQKAQLRGVLNLSNTIGQYSVRQ
jgi:predicted translin family RNA/ssDNA-binding protein